MLNFSTYIDLPLIWVCILAVAVLLYVLLDGFDLGVGILFPFAPNDKSKNQIMNSIAPFWDGNETWLVLAGGGLLAAFPLAFSVLAPAFYIPITMMLMSLIFRGIAFEFKFKASTQLGQKIWGYAFHLGSLFATFFQGTMLGAFIKGNIKVVDDKFAGSVFDWISPFSLIVGITLIAGYGLLGATWIVVKTTDQTQNWARNVSLYLTISVLIAMFAITPWFPFLFCDHGTVCLTFGGNSLTISKLPIIELCIAIGLFISLLKKHEYMPFIITIILFLTAYLGLAISVYPFIIPGTLSLWEASASDESLSLLLIGVAITLPIVLGYTGYSYYIFRGKTKDEDHYH